MHWSNVKVHMVHKQLNRLKRFDCQPLVNASNWVSLLIKQYCKQNQHHQPELDKCWIQGPWISNQNYQIIRNMLNQHCWSNKHFCSSRQSRQSTQTLYEKWVQRPNFIISLSISFFAIDHVWAPCSIEPCKVLFKGSNQGEQRHCSQLLTLSYQIGDET